MENRIVSPELIQAVIGVVVILLTALVPQFQGEIQTIAGAIAAILISLFAAQAAVKAVKYTADAKVTAASVQAKKDC